MSFNEARKIAMHLAKFQKEIDAMRTIMGVEAVNHYKKSFKDGGFTDNSLVKWQGRKRNSYRTIGGARVDDTTRALMVKTGTLKRSINYIRSGRYSVVINTGALPYAKIHNDGLNGKAFGRSIFKMPKRQFIGYSKTLNNKILSRIDSKIKRIFA